MRPKLSPEVVEAIRAALASGLNYSAAAAKVGVSKQSAGRIAQRDGAAKQCRDTSLRRAIGRYMSEKGTGRDAEVGRMLAEGATNRSIAERVGLGESSISYTVTRWTQIFDAEASIPTDHIPIGRGKDPARLAERVMLGLADLGALVLICRGGRFAAALPGSRVARTAERAKPCPIVGTYVEGADRAALEDDIREALR